MPAIPTSNEKNPAEVVYSLLKFTLQHVIHRIQMSRGWKRIWKHRCGRFPAARRGRLSQPA